MPPASQLANAAAQAVGGLAGVGLATVAFAKLGIDGGEDAAARAEGSVAPGFEPVRELFEEHLRRGLEDRAQCCAFVNGVKVVDLWGSGGAAGGGADGSGYSAGSTQNVFSCTKAITSLVVAMLEDRGHLRYDQEVAVAAQRLTSLLEPVLIVALAVMVGCVAFATILPILEASHVL